MDWRAEEFKCFFWCVDWCMDQISASTVAFANSFLSMSIWECINQRSFYGDLVDEVV